MSSSEHEQMMPPPHPSDPGDSSSDSSSTSGSGAGAGAGALGLAGAGAGAGAIGLAGAGAGAGALSGSGAYSGSDSDNANGNLNGNGNLDANGNLNGNLDANGNLNGNENINTVTTDVTTSVDVTLHADIDAMPSMTDALDMHGLSLSNEGGSFLVMPDFSAQTLNGDGNIFDLHQVNELVNNNSLNSPSVSFDAEMGGGSGSLEAFCDPCGPPPSDPASHFNFSQSASIGDTTGASASAGSHSTATSTAAPSINMEAFTQHITMGANIQYNSLPISVVGGDSISDISGAVTHGNHHS